MKLSFTGFNVALVLLLVPGIARADDPNLGQIIGISELGSYAAINNSGQSSGDVNPSNYGLNSNNTFGVNYNNDKGMIRGSARCSTVDGGGGLQTEIPDQTGQSGADNCYCSFFDYTPSGGSAQSFLSNPWVFVPVVDCANNCADNCGRVFAKFDENIGMSNTISIRSGMFNAYTPSSSASGDAITTRTYVDNLLNTKQAKITTTGTNKLMTYGASTGAAPGSRDIVSTLGTSTTATTVPEVGPIVTGLNGKQNTVNGTANYVMTGTGTAGTLGEKPVYSATTNYTNALVTAQTINTAATNAANGEMSCNTYVENAAQTPANCLLWQIVQSAPTGLALASTNPDLMTLIGASSAGSEYAARDNNGEDMNDNASTYGLSSSDHNSFAVDYGSGGVVRGHGRCSTRAGDSGTWDNDTYNVISSNFVDSLTDETGQTGAQYCYCGLDSYTPQNGSAQSLSGPWVFDGVFRGAGDCADLCADFCASYLLAGSDLLAFRSAVFNAYE